VCGVAWIGAALQPIAGQARSHAGDACNSAHPAAAQYKEGWVTEYLAGLASCIKQARGLDMGLGSNDFISVTFGRYL